MADINSIILKINHNHKRALVENLNTNHQQIIKLYQDDKALLNEENFVFVAQKTKKIMTDISKLPLESF